MATLKNCVYTFRQLHVDNADEDNLGSNGDEIYLIYIGFRAQTGAKGSTMTTVNSFDSYDWAKHVKQGATRNIPTNMGRVAIPVAITDFDDLSQAHQQHTALSTQIVGVVGIAMESDDTPWGAVKQMVGKIRNAVHDAVANVVENLPADATQIPFDTMAGQVSDAVAKVKAKLTPNLLQGAVLLIESVGDPDDVVGVVPQYNVCIDPGLIALYNGLQHKNIQVPNLLTPQPLTQVYHASGVQYTVTGDLTLE